MKGVIVDRNAPEELKQFFRDKKYHIVESALIPQLYPAVCTHPDMQLCQISRQVFISAPECFSYYRSQLPGCIIIKGERPIHSTYPGDAAYNAAVYGKIAFHCPKCTDPVVKQYFLGNDIQLISVKQGYSKCNICFLNADALITSDPSIQMAAERRGIRVLKLQNSSAIELKGFQYGFFGGASGKIGKNELVICGDLKTHPEWISIYHFCLENRICPVSAYHGPIQDIGSILEFED